MAYLTIPPSILPFISLLLTLTLIANPTSSSPIKAVSNNPNFDSEIALLGDAFDGGAFDGGAFISLTRGNPRSFGLVLRRDKLKLSEANRGNPASFSSELVFSITPGSGNGVMMVFVPGDFDEGFSGEVSVEDVERLVGVGFDTGMDTNASDVNGNRVGLNVGSSFVAPARNVSDLGLVLNSGEKMRSWIDYDAGSKRLEVRLSRMGEARPLDAIVACVVDLNAMWKGDDVSIWISSSNSNATTNGSAASQISTLYSWSLRVRDGERKQKMGCPMSILAGVIFMTGCGALVSFVGLFLCAIAANRHTIFPPEVLPTVSPTMPGQTDFKYEKISVVVEEDAEAEKEVVKK